MPRSTAPRPGVGGTGHVDQAIASYQKALSLKPDHAEVYCNWAGGRASGLAEQALRHYEKALEIRPDHALAYSNKLFLLAYNALTAPSIP